MDIQWLEDTLRGRVTKLDKELSELPLGLEDAALVEKRALVSSEYSTFIDLTIRFYGQLGVYLK